MLDMLVRALRLPGRRSVTGFVRLCRKRSELVSIVNEARNRNSEDWDEELMGRVKRYVLGGETKDISVYAVKTIDAFDHGHALGVIAEGIDQDKFRSACTKRERSCTRGTLLIPVKSVSSTLRLKYTPKGNLNFHPADTFHYDIEIKDVDSFCLSLLWGLKNGDVKAVFLGNEKKLQGSYQSQSRIAYSYCLSRYGLLDPGKPPLSWANGKNLDSVEQINTIQYLADVDAAHSVPP